VGLLETWRWERELALLLRIWLSVLGGKENEDHHFLIGHFLFLLANSAGQTGARANTKSSFWSIFLFQIALMNDMNGWVDGIG
jgi:hypothetical protein